MSSFDKYKRFLDVALEVSRYGGFSKKYVGAVIVYKNKFISSGANRIKTHPRQKLVSVDTEYLHAETDAIISAMKKKKDLSGCYILVARKTKDGSVTMAKPCSHCLGLIHEVGIKKVVYTGWNGRLCEIDYKHDKFSMEKKA